MTPPAVESGELLARLQDRFGDDYRAPLLRALAAGALRAFDLAGPVPVDFWISLVRRGGRIDLEFARASYRTLRRGLGDSTKVGLTFSREDVSGVWPATPASHLPRKGGRPSFDWDAFSAEAVRVANTPDGLPEVQADFERQMLEWCRAQWGSEPGESTVRAKISIMYKGIRGQKS